MTKEDIHKIREIANDHRTEPRKQVWDRLSDKLGHQQKVREVSFYRKISVAAGLFAVVCAGILVKHYSSSHHSSELFATNEMYKPIVIEELGNPSSTNIYTISDVNGLIKAFTEKNQEPSDKSQFIFY